MEVVQAYSVCSEGKKKYMCFEEEEIPFARNLLICTLASCKHIRRHENESCGFLHISANEESTTSSVMYEGETCSFQLSTT